MRRSCSSARSPGFTAAPPDASGRFGLICAGFGTPRRVKSSPRQLGRSCPVAPSWRMARGSPINFIPFASARPSTPRQSLCVLVVAEHYTRISPRLIDAGGGWSDCLRANPCSDTGWMDKRPALRAISQAVLFQGRQPCLVLHERGSENSADVFGVNISSDSGIAGCDCGFL